MAERDFWMLGIQCPLLRFARDANSIDPELQERKREILPLQMRIFDVEERKKSILKTKMIR